MNYYSFTDLKKLSDNFKTEVSLLVMVTPEIAEQLLLLNTANRNLVKSNVNKYSKDMTSDSWLHTGLPIIISKEGKILDGQTRLNSIIKTGKNQKMYITTGIDPEAFKVIDIGRIRTGADIISILGVKDSNKEFYAVLKNKYYFEADKLGMDATGGGNLRKTEKLSNNGIVEYYRNLSPTEEQSIKESIEVGRDLYKIFLENKLRILNISTLSFLHYIFKNKNEDKADEFLRKLANHKSNGPQDPIGQLTLKLISFSKKKGKLLWGDKINYIFKAWNLYVTGQTMKNLLPDSKIPELESGVFESELKDISEEIKEKVA